MKVLTANLVCPSGRNCTADGVGSNPPYGLCFCFTYAAPPAAPVSPRAGTTVSVSRDGQPAQYPHLAFAPPVDFSVAVPLDMPVVVPGAILFFCAA
jgi:hypothetical protein